MIDYINEVSENKKSREFLCDALLKESGPVAQLGARFHGMEEVVGSIPTRSTKSFQQFSRPCEFAFEIPQPKIQPKDHQTVVDVSLMASRNFS